MLRITLPSFYAPFPPTMHPQVEEVHQHTLAWARQHHLVQQEAAIERLRVARFAWLTARGYPSAGLEELALANDLNTWLFMLDDQFDDGELGRQPERIPLLIAQLLANLDYPPANQSSPLGGPIGASLRDIWTRIVAFTTPRWQRRFLRHLAAYFHSYIWETTNRAQGLIPEITLYIEKRQDTGAMLLALDFIDLTEHTSLPAEVYASSQFQALLRITNNAVCWSNDIFSLEKEIARGDLNNLVLAVQQEQDCTLQEAVDLVNAMITREIQLFETLVGQLPGAFPRQAQELQRYCAVMQSWIRGNLDWSLETVRYTEIERGKNAQQLSYLEPLLPESQTSP